MTKLFHLINSECNFANDILNSGVELIRKANFQDKGLYYQAFTCLSVGLERLMKLIIILDNYLQHNQLYTKNELKNIGHDISNLYSKCINIGNNRNIDKKYSDPDEIYKKIIDILSEFANLGEQNRYYNLNYISLANNKTFSLPKDTTCKWVEQIDYYIYNNKVSEKKKIDIEQQNMFWGQMLNEGALILFEAEDNSKINNGLLYMAHKSRQIACQGFRVLFVAQIIRYLSRVLSHISDKLKSIHPQDIPYLNEYFIIYRNDDNILKKRKCFTL